MSKPICNSKTLNFQPHTFNAVTQSSVDSSRNAQVSLHNLSNIPSTTSIISNVLCIDSSLNATSLHDLYTTQHYLVVSLQGQHLIIDNSFGLETNINLYSADGNRILSETSNLKKIDVAISSSLASGLYFYSVKSSKQVVSGKWMKW